MGLNPQATPKQTDEAVGCRDGKVPGEAADQGEREEAG
jgi:hypothetical protein